ncbi:hypothetical protein PROFUN_03720 [Planoprotostelium fungivorum]|uniref:BTB domain-containing protein n=1 Tax=Planoprotostelium fungivorum TaxID=1890364 RepID=A0A2P6NDK0_9EUKA|nr:hypothetical protein PROFUN_03720 [Planoprotostelium fungivorum]
MKMKRSQTVEAEARLTNNAKFQNAERVVLNIGGTRFETCASTLSKYPDSLLGTMFHERNRHLRCMDSKGEYFFDRCPNAFTAIIEFYRTGHLQRPHTVNRKVMRNEVDFWMLPLWSMRGEEGLGGRFAKIAMRAVRKKAQPTLGYIKEHIIQSIAVAAAEGLQSFTIEFKENEPASMSMKPSSTMDSSSFLSNFSNRELLLRDLMQTGLHVSFNDMSSVIGHSYILSIELWNRFTPDRPPDDDSLAHFMSNILSELRQGVEVKTGMNDHILTVKNISGTLQ